MDGGKIPLSALFISVFFIFSIPNTKQNKKRQSPKDLNLFFVNKVGIFISLKTQPLRNPPHPSVGIWFFFFVPLHSRRISWDALRRGCRNQMQVNVLVHCVPWGSSGGPRSRDCAFLCWAHLPGMAELQSQAPCSATLAFPECADGSCLTWPDTTCTVQPIPCFHKFKEIPPRRLWEKYVCDLRAGRGGSHGRGAWSSSVFFSCR